MTSALREGRIPEESLGVIYQEIILLLHLNCHLGHKEKDAPSATSFAAIANATAK
jgi:hypothetical protein